MELSYLKLWYFVIGETTDNPQISLDTKLAENASLYPKGVSFGNWPTSWKDQMCMKSGLSFSVVQFVSGDKT